MLFIDKCSKPNVVILVIIVHMKRKIKRMDMKMPLDEKKIHEDTPRFSFTRVYTYKKKE